MCGFVGHFKLAFSLWKLSGFYVSSVSLAPTINIFAAESKRILCFKRFAGFALSMRTPSDLYVSSASLAPQIRIFAAETKRALRFKRFAGTHYAAETNIRHNLINILRIYYNVFTSALTICSKVTMTSGSGQTDWTHFRRRILPREKMFQNNK